MKSPYSLTELNRSLVALEAELRRFEVNCNKFNEYQEATATIAQVWAAWLAPKSEDRESI